MYPASATSADAALPQRRIGRRGEGLPARVGNDAMRDAGAGGPLEPRRLGAVADHEDDFGRIGRVGRGIDQRLQVRPAAGDQNADFEPGHGPLHRVLRRAVRADILRRDACIASNGVASQTALSPTERGRRCRDDTGSGAHCNDLAADERLRPGGRSGRRIAGAAFLSCCCSFRRLAQPARAQEADPFSATVKVDARADTAAKARETARLDGQRRALAAIAERLSGGEAPAKLPKLDDKAITDLVASFEVANERMSAVRYVADYTFHFRPAETRRVLACASAGAANRRGDRAKPPAAKPDRRRSSPAIPHR